jgi:nitroimidazol reductase NimA-like FMN-containing flavoprotein (pyridoxamine 5'-phosphate oxidase superfamily)
MSLTMSPKEREAFLADVHVGVISIARAGRKGPLTVPIWYDYSPGGELWIITDGDSIKGRLLEHAGRFSLCVQTETPPYKYVSVEGPIASIEPSDRERDTRPMAHRYLGVELGDGYIAATHDEDSPPHSLLIKMTPETWFSTDYSKQFAAPPQA